MLHPIAIFMGGKYWIIISFYLPLLTVFWLPNTLQPHSLFWLYAVIFSGIASLLSIGYLFLPYEKANIKLRLFDLLLFLFLVYIAIRYLLQTGFHLNFYLTQWLLLFSCYVIWRCLFEFIIQNGKKSLLLALVFIFIAIGCVETLLGFGQLYGFFPSNNAYFSVTGHFANPDHFAGFIGSFAPLSFGVYLFRSKMDCKVISNTGLATFILILAILPAITIRGSWLAVLAGVVFLLYHKYEIDAYVRAKVNTWPRKVLLAILIIGACFGGGKALYDLKPDSAFGRLFIWKTTVGMITEKPLFGHGFDQFKVAYNKAQAEYVASGAASEKEKMIAGNVEHAHNEFLQIWAELGLVGLTLFLGMIGSLFFSLGRNNNRFGESNNKQKALLLCVKASLIAIIVSSLFAFPLHIFPTLINFFFLLALGITLQNNQPLAILYLSSLKVKTGGVLLVMLLASLGWFSLKKYELYQQWEEANRLMAYNQYEEAIPGFEKLYSAMNKNGVYLFRYGGALTGAKDYKKAIPILERAKAFYSNPNLYMVLAEAYEQVGSFDRALANYEFSWNIMPHKIYPLYRIAKVYQKMGNEEALVVLAKQIVDMEQKVSTTAGRQIKNEMNEIIERNNSK